eukprot:CAMPEP_0205937130 /NCGR_PEP_ID=MMETSP1325-20131115/43301_1 /ASSEMBLY_ACC=CAM_ASM_000708 /TAXON_ID=236786 /ORGANISM="Florenciella sp., Strain RCC1007" /LENGTH=55 /DNA_ID=CAMNT_0053307365 /DNA_START=460 /DNA_END=624 /DNA_ORIENTATION=-
MNIAYSAEVWRGAPIARHWNRRQLAAGLRGSYTETRLAATALVRRTSTRPVAAWC